VRPTAPLAASPSRSSSNLMLLMVAIAIALSLIAIATTLMPASALPQAVLRVLDRRRQDVVLAGIVVSLSIGVGLLVVVVVR
jgi:hypothetical protein